MRNLNFDRDNHHKGGLKAAFMPFFRFINTFALIALLTFYAGIVKAALPQELSELFKRMEAKGATNIVLIYDWGDGEVEELPRNSVAENLDHRYRKAGTYKLVRKLRFKNPKGKLIVLPVDEKNIVIKQLPTPGKLDVEINPAETEAGTEVSLSASIEINPSFYELERKPHFEWFIDEEFDPYEEGMITSHVFHIPNGPEKPFYTITAKARFRWRERSNSGSELWTPGILEMSRKVTIKPSMPPEIVDISPDVTGAPGEMVDTPVFITIRYQRLYESKDDFAKRADVLKPRVYIGRSRTPFVPELVKVRVNRPGEPPYSQKDFNTEVIWMVNPVMPVDQSDYEPDGSCFMGVSVPDPKGTAKKIEKLLTR